MKILLIGRMGQVAWELQRELSCLGVVIAIDRYTTPYAIDLLSNESIDSAINAIQPDVIINAAAYTAVDLAESEMTQAMQINGHALATLAAAAKRCAAVLVHYSTDYVFDGTASTPYHEAHPTAPQSSYGRSKLLGEQAIQNSGVEHLILRTAWVYGNRGKNFLLTMLRLMRERSSLSIVADQLGAPTWSRHIASSTALILAQSRQNGKVALGAKSGIYHLTNAGQGSWFDFAASIYHLARHAGILTHEVTLNAITTAEYPTPAKRPAYSVLSGDKLATEFELHLPPWQLALEQCFSDYLLNS